MNLNYSLILASSSPRRQQLLRDAGFEFTVSVKHTDESYPSGLPAKVVAAYIAKQKALPFDNLGGNTLVVTADTVVVLQNQILGKPKEAAEARQMLLKLSNQPHQVITGVCLTSANKQVCFSETTVVHFKALIKTEIDYYIKHYKPFDKAGAYGIQEWIGMIAVEKIEGSYFNVMGMPMHRIYAALQEF